MKNSILASFDYCSSTDENPKHDKCPNDENSWCFYNHALAINEIPGKHNDHIHTPMNDLVLKHNIISIYLRLT